MKYDFNLRINIYKIVFLITKYLSQVKCFFNLPLGILTTVLYPYTVRLYTPFSSLHVELSPPHIPHQSLIKMKSGYEIISKWMMTRQSLQCFVSGLPLACWCYLYVAAKLLKTKEGFTFRYAFQNLSSFSSHATSSGT